MHFLLIPYALLSLIFVTQFLARREAHARAGLLLVAAITTALLFVTMWLRPATGDSWRYLEYFRDLRAMGLMDALNYREGDPLYVLLNWFAGFLGDGALVLFGATLLVYFSVFIAATRRLASPVGTLVVLMCYTAFPFFVAYAANGLRQGLAIVFLLMAYVAFFQKQRQAWAWLVLAPLWHSGAWLGVGVVVVHQFMCRFVRSAQLRWVLVFAALLGSLVLSVTGLNEGLMAQLPDIVSMRQSQAIYFEDAEAYGYRAGFRLDFFLFSMLPLVTGFLLRQRASSFAYEGPGWWLSLYLSLNVVYHLFSFAPFSDRFAGFSWFLMPLVIYLQVRETGSRNLQTLFVALVCLVNVAMLQLYTGNFIRVPEGW